MSIGEAPSTLDVLLALTRVETKVDTYMTQAADHEARIRTLEARKWPLAPVHAVVSLGALALSGVALIVQ